MPCRGLKLEIMENLKGRWIKALLNKPDGGRVMKGEYGKIIDDVHADFSTQSGYLLKADKKRPLNTEKYELMPEGFDPNNNNEEDYAGRWVRAKVECQGGCMVKLGDYTKIVKKDLTRGFYILPSNYVIKYPLENEYWELMPEGWSPETQEKEAPIPTDVLESKFNIGDVVNISKGCESCCDHYRIGYTGDGAKENVTICEKKYNEEEKEWWYRYKGREFGNWFVEDGISLSSPKQEKMSGALVEGEYYAAISTEKRECGSNIFISEGKNKISYCIMGSEEARQFSKNEDWATGKLGEDYRLATQEEREHLDKCIAANKFIPKEEALKQKDMFKKGDYIVTTRGEEESIWIRNNYVYCQCEDKEHIYFSPDSQGGRTYDNKTTYDKKQHWRYATQEEIEEYKRVGNPYDVTTLEKKDVCPYKAGDIVVCIGESDEENECFTPDEDPNYAGAGWDGDLCFKITCVRGGKNDIKGKILDGGKRSCGVWETFVRMATREEQEYYNKKGRNYYITEIPKQEEKSVTEEYNVGDEVYTYRYDDDDEDQSPFFVESMKEYVGKKGQITEIRESGCYRVHNWNWNKKALSKVPKQENVPSDTTESFLKKQAIVRYPIGSTYKVDQVPAYGCGKDYTISPESEKDYDCYRDHKGRYNVIICGTGVYYHAEEKWAPIISNSMPSEEECRRIYPKATEFCDLVHGNWYIVKEEEYTIREGNNTIYVEVRKPNPTDNATCCIYKNGKWANVKKW